VYGIPPHCNSRKWISAASTRWRAPPASPSRRDAGGDVGIARIPTPHRGRRVADAGEDDDADAPASRMQRGDGRSERHQQIPLSAKKEFAIKGFVAYGCLKILSIRRTFDAC
jgi:hypothetical protein